MIRHSMLLSERWMLWSGWIVSLLCFDLFFLYFCIVRIIEPVPRVLTKEYRAVTWCSFLLFCCRFLVYFKLSTYLCKKVYVIMEEKRKKMTKAEAFEWLKCKKVDASNNECSVQSKLFSLGVVWRCTLNTNPCSSVKYLFINNECRMSHCGSDSDYYKYHCYEEISAEDILSLEIVEDEPLDKWDEFARCVAKVQEKIEDDEVCIITKGNFLTMTK